jgi:quercetin dioxygenase-like cupin family protein
MFTDRSCWTPIVKLGTAAATVLLCASIARAQPEAASAPHTAGKALMTRDVVGMPGKEVTVSTVEYPPGASSPPHRHDAQVFVYVLQGKVIMQVKGGPRMTLGPGEMFYESPTDIHSVSANASSTEPAKFLVFMLKDKGAQTRSVAPDQAQ